MRQDLIDKFKKISIENNELQVKEFGLKPSKESLALDAWLRLNPLERYEIMKTVKPAKTWKIHQNRCLKEIEKYI